MRDPRNPFRLRRSESIDSDATFLSLFEPGILDIMPAEKWKESVHILRSAAGGGKTSLIRLFVPNVLHTLHARRSEEQLRELFQKVKELGAIDETGPKLLGVMLLCGRSYSRLQDLPLDQARKDRLFFGLLNARIVLAVLHNILAFKQLRFPEDLERIRIQSSGFLLQGARAWNCLAAARNFFNGRKTSKTRCAAVSTALDRCVSRAFPAMIRS